MIQKNKKPSYEKVFKGTFYECLTALIEEQKLPSFVWLGNHSTIEKLESKFKGIDFKDVVDLEPQFAKIYWKDMKSVLGDKSIKEELTQ